MFSHKYTAALIMMLAAGIASGQIMQRRPANQPEKEAPPKPQPPKPITGTIADKLNTMPKDYWPIQNENSIRERSRYEWVDKNMQNVGPVQLAGTITYIDTEGSGKQQQIVLRINLKQMEIWGRWRDLELHCTLTKTKPEEALSWRNGDAITVSGAISAHILADEASSIAVEMPSATLMKPPATNPTSIPN